MSELKCDGLKSQVINNNATTTTDDLPMPKSTTREDTEKTWRTSVVEFFGWFPVAAIFKLETARLRLDEFPNGASVG